VEIVETKMRIFLTGGTGQFGKSFLNHPSNHIIYAPTRNELNLLKKSEVLKVVESFMPDVVINASAWTNVAEAELNPKITYEANLTGVESLLLASKNIHAKFIQLSTDYVFDGKSTKPYLEDSKKNPLSIYGASKSLAEDFIVGNYIENSYIVRTSWLYSAYGNNFVKTILRKLLSDKENVFVVDDQYGCPTLAQDLVQAICTFCEDDIKSGIYHFTNLGSTSWHLFAREIALSAGENPDRVIPIKTPVDREIVERPFFSVLSTNKFETATGKRPPSWEDSLRDSFKGIRMSVESEKLK